MKEDSNHFSDFFAPTEDDRSFVAVRSVKRSLLAELNSNGSTPPASAEEVLARWPTDPCSDRDAASVLFEDFQQRHRSGEAPNREEYEERYPEHKDSLTGLFDGKKLLESISGGSSLSVPHLALPVVGDALFGFRLRHELGAGAFARVFLAEQADLAGRPVVVKVSDTDGDEPQTLAQMQHTNIVPIYSVHENAQAGLRAVCMPYFGGASLSRVLDNVWHGKEPPAHGRQFVTALAAVGGPALSTEAMTPAAAADGPLAHLAELNYVQACVLLVAQLADGLQHAHQRGVLHRDIKPSNILLGADGQPMLLDFNLAHHISGPKAHASATLGGTIAYMAPEHLRALAARDPALVRLVDQRSDVYSLGMVLFEMLLGHSPFQQSASYAPAPMMIEAMAVERSQAAPSLRAQRPDAPWGLESILRKCLAPRQEDRYQQPADLAEDLRRYLSDLPLKHAPELSRVERLEKWVRRHPQVKSTGAIATAAVLLLLVAGAALAGVRNHLTRTQEELKLTQGRERLRHFGKFNTEALCLLNTTSDLRDNLLPGKELAEKALQQYGVLERDDWQAHPFWQRLSAEEQRRMAEDIRDLLQLLAWAWVKVHPSDPTAPRNALALLDRAEAIHDLPPSPALFRDRAYYYGLLQEPDKAKVAQARANQLQPATWRDHYLLAAACIRQGGRDRHTRALVELNRAVELNRGKRDFWTHMQRGICHLELKQYDRAARDFGVCIGVWPEFAWGHFNCGLALELAKHKEDALAHYTVAVDRDPKFVHAWWNRGIVRMDLGQFEDALKDFQTTAALGRDDAHLHLALGKAHANLGKHAEAEVAFTAMFARLPEEPAERAKILCEYGFTVLRRLPRQAERAFAQVLTSVPDHHFGLYGMGMVLVEGGREADAIAYVTWALQANPSYVDARIYRAVLYARRGYLNDAYTEIVQCLQQDRVRATTRYNAACVLARIAEHLERDPKKGAESLSYKAAAVRRLQEAFTLGLDRKKAPEDEDLASLHNYAPFRALLTDQP